jgi:hypothetical protein
MDDFAVAIDDDAAERDLEADDSDIEEPLQLLAAIPDDDSALELEGENVVALAGSDSTSDPPLEVEYLSDPDEGDDTELEVQMNPQRTEFLMFFSLST